MRKLLVLLTILSLCSQAGFAQSRQITGTVVNESDGKPAVGVMVTVSGTTTAAITDGSGRFTLRAEPNATLSFTSLGLATQEIALEGQTQLVVTMAESVESLEEVVVLGFASVKKVNLTGAVSSVGADVFENRPVTSVGQALQGVLPNLSVSIGNGQPNTVPSFALRGGATMEQDANDSNKWKVFNKSPLILVDGVEYSTTMLNQLNPNDIASTTIIKDASAAAIYGVKATYGVMLVTTKSGNFGQAGQVTYSYDISLDSPTAIPDVMDSWSIQRMSMDRKLWTGGTVTEADEKKLAAMENWMANPTPENAYYMDGDYIRWVASMDPYEVLLKKFQTTHKHNMSVRGGSEKISYYVSLGYQSQDGLYKLGDEQYQRYNALARINAKVKPWFNLEARASYGYTKYDAPFLVSGKGSVWNAMKNSEVSRNINSPIKTGPNDPVPNAYTDNILGYLDYGATYEDIDTSVALSVKPQFIITSWLKAIGEFSYMPRTKQYNSHRPKRDHVVVDQWTSTTPAHGTDENRAYFRKGNTTNYTINAYLDVNKTFGKHNITATIGFNQEQNEHSQLEAELRHLFNADVQDEAAATTQDDHRPYWDAYLNRARAGFYRVGYIYNDRYLFEANGRYDGSSRFPAYKRYVFFPSFSAGWIISEENFMEFSNGWLNHLKFRASYGKLGSQPSSSYPYQETVKSGATNYLIGGQWANYLAAPRLATPNLTWQKAATKNFGFDAIFLRDRLSVEYSWFERKVTDVLLEGDVAYPSVLGIASADMPKVNSGTMRSYGFELVLSWRDRLPNGINYKVGATLSDQRTQVLSFPKNSTKLLSELYSGMYTGTIWGYSVGGILQESDLELQPDGKTYKFYGPNFGGTTTYWPGYLWYKDRNGDGVVNNGQNTLDEHGDLRILGNSTPRFQYGVTVDLDWKGFDLNMFFQGVGKRDVWISDNAYWGGDGTAGSRWMAANSWRPDRTDAKFPMYGYTTAKDNSSDAYLINGAYLRLKQLVLGYTLPTKLTEKAGISNLRFSVSAFNVFTMSQIPDVFDVDQISSAYPQKRTIAFGAQITF